MRVLVDTNVYVSRLLVENRSHANVAQLIDAAILDEYTLLLPEDVLDELYGLRDRKAYLRDRITERDLNDFVHVLLSIAVVLPRQIDPIPAVLRDRKDDFLLTASILGDADILVTGDRDLIDIKAHLDRPEILTVAEFVDLLRARSFDSK